LIAALDANRVFKKQQMAAVIAVKSFHEECEKWKTGGRSRRAVLYERPPRRFTPSLLG
jgi:hypothetical protein